MIINSIDDLTKAAHEYAGKRVRIKTDNVDVSGEVYIEGITFGSDLPGDDIEMAVVTNIGKFRVEIGDEIDSI